MSVIARRPVMGAGLGLLTGALLPDRARVALAADLIEIRMASDAAGSEVHFDPIGLHVMPGQRIRWRCLANVHTTTAYHPKNMDHSLRIPQSAEPWNSGYLLPGHTFEVTLIAEGVYDYFCIPHEMAGMVGRIIVGAPVGPGALPFDYFRGRSGASSWLAVPEPAQKALPAIPEIITRRIIHPPGVAS